MLALELADSGIRVNAVAPGFIATDMFLESHDEASRRRIAGTHPLGRVGGVDEVASAVSFLCSGDASFVTGAVLPVDGGLACQMAVPDLGDQA
jgi:NAD(P)-dependent dehydrogenase (short-subunit alcohol dehydrogenase family)